MGVRGDTNKLTGSILWVRTRLKVGLKDYMLCLLARCPLTLKENEKLT